MATLMQSPYSGFERQNGEGWDRHSKRTGKILNKLAGVSRRLPVGKIEGALLQFPVADGHAYYLVTREKPLMLQHVPYGDRYEIPYSQIRGIRRRDVLLMQDWDRGLARFFGGA